MKLQANEEVRYLFGQIQGDKTRDDFALVFFLLMFSRLNNRAEGRHLNLRLHPRYPSLGPHNQKIF